MDEPHRPSFLRTPTRIPLAASAGVFLIALSWATHLDAQDAPLLQLPAASAVAPEAFTSLRGVGELGDGRVLDSDRTGCAAS